MSKSAAIEALGVRTPLTSTASASYATATTTTTAMTMKVTTSSAALQRNPFRYESPIDSYEKCKIVVLCLLGVPLLRVLLLVVIVLVLVLVSNVAMLGFERFDTRTGRKNVLPTWRRWLAAPVPYLIRAALFVVGYYWIPTSTPRGFDCKCDLPRIVISNHISFVDGLFLLYYFTPSIAMKAEVAEIPLIGKVVQSTQPILIDRTTPEGRKHALQEIADHIAAPAFPPLLIFPEGTTSNQDYLTKFKVGSFTSGAPCQPVVIKYPFQHFDVSWTPGVSGAYLLLRMLCQVYNRMEVQVLPVYTPSPEEVASPALYAENVRQVMAKALGVECTNHAFEDVALLLQVGKYAHEHVLTVTDVGEVVRLTDLRGGDIDKLVRYFVKHDLNQDGQISLDEMHELFPNDDCTLVERLFELVDADGNGQIDFRELCMALRALSANGSSVDELIRFAFRLYDTDNNGVIDASELEAMLRFNQMFYGASAERSIDAFMAEVRVASSTDGVDTSGDAITYDVFARLMVANPDLLGYAKSTLEILRGSMRE
uniref:EF-hand domain-containing protein n=1 Tax=Globisporangium ultimum (strain ATCC 200006 / CBS 805.95 / DAOM BR144) TaxID=431595 RepID=K3WJ81_GLOUD